MWEWEWEKQNWRARIREFWRIGNISAEKKTESAKKERKQNEREKAKNENKENLEGQIKINLHRSTSDRNEKYSILSK